MHMPRWRRGWGLIQPRRSTCPLTLLTKNSPRTTWTCCTILRTHTTKNPDSERRIWAYPEPYADIMRDEFHLRYALIPYIYTEARRTYDTGVAFLRPLYYDWPDAEQAYTAKNEYLFGDNMIVAPVVSPVDKSDGLASESVWLPRGEWIE